MKRSKAANFRSSKSGRGKRSRKVEATKTRRGEWREGRFGGGKFRYGRFQDRNVRTRRAIREKEEAEEVIVSEFPQHRYANSQHADLRILFLNGVAYFRSDEIDSNILS